MGDTNGVDKQPSLVDMPVKKKISFISAIILVIGNCIGSGIFFKSKTVLGDSGLNLPIAIVAWVVAGVVIICMALALVEISSGRNDNLGIIGWCKAFNGKYIYKGCKYFMVFVYLPLTYFFMPLYVLMAFQDALSAFGTSNNFGTGVDWIIWSVIAMAMSSYFIFMSGLSSRVGDIQNKIITYVKFIPLAVAAILGWIVASSNGFNDVYGEKVTQHWEKSAEQIDFFTVSPVFGFFGSLAAIFFAYDGFYATAGIQTEMREPKKTPKAIVLGLAIVTAIYLAIAISMSVAGTNANLSTFSAYLAKHHVAWIGGIINLFVAIGVMGILNGFSMWCPRYLQDLVLEGELPVPTKWFVKCKNSTTPRIGIIYALVLTVPLVILFDIIGGLGYMPGGYAGDYDAKGYVSTAQLYNFADLLATWCAVFAFMFIACAIFGGIRNRKTNHIQVSKSKYFVPTAWVSVILVFAALIMSVIQPIVNIILVAVNQTSLKDDYSGDLLANILLVVVLVLMFAAFFLPIFIEKWADSKRLEKLNNIMRFANDQTKLAKMFELNNDSKKLIRYLITEEKLNTWQAKAISKLPIKKKLDLNEYYVDEDYFTSLVGYIEATNIGIESFKINVKSSYLSESNLNIIKQ